MDSKLLRSPANRNATNVNASCYHTVPCKRLHLRPGTKMRTNNLRRDFTTSRGWPFPEGNEKRLELSIIFNRLKTLFGRHLASTENQQLSKSGRGAEQVAGVVTARTR